ncbi:porin [Curvibacter gracilis]|uniref:porin n=1 Tax=Curvibacter gracilis TaxID=230310 RepID=UPI0004872136|nr:porin [Curvibacter gracilis]
MNPSTQLAPALMLGLIGALPWQAQAQTAPASGVQIFGVIDAAVGSVTSPSGVNALDKPVNKQLSGGLSTSNWGLRGQEDLGEGRQAIFELSSFIRNESGAAGRSDALPAPVNVAADPYFSRAAWLGLSDARLGRVRLGNITTLLFTNSVTSNALGDSTTFSPINLLTFVGSPLSGGTAWANSVVYDSPVRAGLSGSLAYAASQNLGGPNSAARLAYAQGAFNSSLAWQSVNRNPVTFADGTSSNDTRAWQWAASYDFSPLKVFGHLGQTQNRGTAAAPQAVRYRVWDLSASLPIGAGRWLAGYGSRTTGNTPTAVAATAAGGNVSRKVLTLGYDHYLSARTEVYVLASQDQTRTRQQAATPVLVNATGHSFAVGIRHRF